MTKEPPSPVSFTLKPSVNALGWVSCLYHWPQVRVSPVGPCHTLPAGAVPCGLQASNPAWAWRVDEGGGRQRLGEVRSLLRLSPAHFLLIYVVCAGRGGSRESGDHRDGAAHAGSGPGPALPAGKRMWLSR